MEQVGKQEKGSGRIQICELMPGIQMWVCESQKFWVLGPRVGGGGGSLRTPAHSLLPAGLSLHFHAAPATFYQRRMGSWGWAPVQQPFFEFCERWLRRHTGAEAAHAVMGDEAGEPQPLIHQCLLQDVAAPQPMGWQCQRQVSRGRRQPWA